jgi:hypothetical protein
MSQGMKTTKGGGCLGMTAALIASTVVVAVVMDIVLVLPFFFHEGVQGGAKATGTSKGENDSDSTWEGQLQAYRQAAKTKGDDQNQWKHGQLTVWKNGQPHVYLNGADGKMTEQNNRPWDDSTIIYALLAFTGISAGLLIAGIFLFVPGIFRTPIPKPNQGADEQKSKEKAVPPEIPKTASQKDSDGNSDKTFSSGGGGPAYGNVDPFDIFRSVFGDCANRGIFDEFFAGGKAANPVTFAAIGKERQKEKLQKNKILLIANSRFPLPLVSESGRGEWTSGLGLCLVRRPDGTHYVHRDFVTQEKKQFWCETHTLEVSVNQASDILLPANRSRGSRESRLIQLGEDDNREWIYQEFHRDINRFRAVPGRIESAEPYGHPCKTNHQETAKGTGVRLDNIMKTVKGAMGTQPFVTLSSSDPKISAIWDDIQKAKVRVHLTRNAQIATSFNLAANTVTFAVIGTEC